MAYTFNPFTGNLDNTSETTGVVTPPATESVAGKIEIATQAETDAGVDDTRAITPAKLANAPLQAAGNTTEIQYNNAGLLDASVDLTWDDTEKELGLGGDIVLDTGGAFTTYIQSITATEDQVISFPDATGVVALVAGLDTEVQFNSNGALAGSANLTFDGSTLTSSTAGAASTPAVNLDGTWFSGGTAETTKPQFLIEPDGTTSTGWDTDGTGIGVNAASGFTGNLLDLQIDGTSQFKLNKEGSIISPNDLIFTRGSTAAFRAGTTSFSVKDSLKIGASPSNPDVFINRDAADTLAQRRTTNAQTYRLYNTYTDASNYERGMLEWNTDILLIGTQAAGTGTARELKLQTGGTDAIAIDTSQNVTIGAGDLILDDGGSFDTTIQSVTATANRVISFPDATGTVALVSGSNNQIQYNSSGALAGSANLTFDGSTLDVSTNGAASTPPSTITGTWFSGGTAETTKPQFLIEPDGTTSTAWDTNGTGIGANAASGFTGNLLDLQVDGTSKLKVGASGTSASNPLITSGQSTAWIPTVGAWAFGTSSTGFVTESALGIGMPAGKLVWFGNNTTGLYSTRDLAISRDQANVLLVTDGSTGTGYLKLIPTTVGALTAAATVGAGTRAFVTDSANTLSSHHGQVVAGGGSDFVPVFSDGTNWIVG